MAEQQTDINRIIEACRAERDFDIFPEQALKLMLSIPDYFDFRLPLASYFGHLREYYVPEEVIARVAHAVVSYLQEMYRRGAPELAQFILPPTIDPYNAPDPENPYGMTLIAAWEAENQGQVKADAKSDFGMIQEFHQRPSGLVVPTQTIVNMGSMFTDKTNRIIEVVAKVEDHYWTDGTAPRIIPVVAAAMQEPYIKTRVGVRPNSIRNVETTIQAQMVGTQELIETLLRPDLRPGDIVLVDEISFVAFTEEENDAIIGAIEQANSRGIFVVMAGLNDDFRMINLPFTATLANHNIPYMVMRECNARYAYQVNGETVTGNGSTATFRVDRYAGFGDFLLPVPVSRIFNFVGYGAIPKIAHPFGVLRESDPEIYSEILAVGEREELLNQYAARHEQEHAVEG